MNDAIKLVRAQKILSAQCLEKLRAVKTALQESSNGRGVAGAVQALEPALAKLSKLAALQEEFLRKSGKKQLAACASDMPDPAEREEAVQLLAEAQEAQRRLQKELAATRMLLKRGKEFADFHINVMTQTAANDTYAPPGASEVENRRGLKMFEANV